MSGFMSAQRPAHSHEPAEPHRSWFPPVRRPRGDGVGPLLRHASDEAALRRPRSRSDDTLVLHAKCSACAGEDEEESRGLQRRASSDGPRDGARELVDQALGSAGEPLDAVTRSDMESRFGQDFGEVRVHTDGTAAASAQAVSAHAYTRGNHIVFGHGAYSPGTERGKALLAHELSHTLQQPGAGIARSAEGAVEVSHPSDPAEQEADEMAARAMSGPQNGPIEAVQASAGPRLHRSVERPVKPGPDDQPPQPRVRDCQSCMGAANEDFKAARRACRDAQKRCASDAERAYKDCRRAADHQSDPKKQELMFARCDYERSQAKKRCQERQEGCAAKASSDRKMHLMNCRTVYSGCPAADPPPLPDDWAELPD